MHADGKSIELLLTVSDGEAIADLERFQDHDEREGRALAALSAGLQAMRKGAMNPVKQGPYRVFISYSHDKDHTGLHRLGFDQAELALDLQSALESVQGIRTFVDVEGIGLVEDWQAAIATALAPVSLLILLASVESAGSDEVLREYECAKQLKKPVLVVTLDPIESITGKLTRDFGVVNHYPMVGTAGDAREPGRLAAKVGQMLDLHDEIWGLVDQLGSSRTDPVVRQLVNHIPRCAAPLLKKLQALNDQMASVDGFDGYMSLSRVTESVLEALTAAAQAWPQEADGPRWLHTLSSEELVDAVVRSLGGYRYQAASALLREIVRLHPHRGALVRERVRKRLAVAVPGVYFAIETGLLRALVLAALDDADALRTLEVAAVSAKEPSSRRRAIEALGLYGNAASGSALESIETNQAHMVHAVEVALESIQARAATASVSVLAPMTRFLNPLRGDAPSSTVDGLTFCRRDVKLALYLFEANELTPTIVNWGTLGAPPTPTDIWLTSGDRGTDNCVLHDPDRYISVRNLFRLVELLLDGQCSRNAGAADRKTFERLGFTVKPWSEARTQG